MKKFWQSAAALLMGAAFAFTGVACGDNPASSGSSPSSNSTPATSAGGEDNKSELSRSYIAGAIKQLSSAQSLRATFAMDVNASASPSGYKQEGKVEGELILSRSDAGINAKISLTDKEKLDFSDFPEETTDETIEIYFIDGFIYEYDAEADYYEISRFDLGLPFSDVLTEALGSAPLSFDLGGTDGQMDDLLAMLAALLEEKGTVEETSAKLALSYDAKALLNSGIDFINKLNNAADLEEALNIVLGLLSPGLTVNSILEVVKPLGVQTLGQITALLDIYLASSGTSLSEIKNTLLDLEEVQSLLYMIFAEDIMAGTLSENFVEEWKTKSINEILTELGLDGITINEIIDGLINNSAIPDPGNPDAGTGSGEPVEPFDLSKFIEETVKPYLQNTTLEDLGVWLPALDGTEVTRADTDMQIEFGADKKISSVACGFDLGMTVSEEVDGENYVSTSAVSASFKIEEIGASQVNIALPADAVCVYAIWNDNLTAELGMTNDFAEISFMRMNASADPEKVEYVYEGVLTIYNAAGEDCVMYEFTYQPPQSLAEDSMTITITAGQSWNLMTDDKQDFDEAKLKELFGDSLTAEIPVFLEYGFVDLSEFPGYVGWNA